MWIVGKNKNYLISTIDLCLALSMDRSYFSKLIKKLNIIPHKIRGKRNLWTNAFDLEQVKLILEHREGIPHNLDLPKEDICG
jgi:hypothetical protein